MKKQLLAGAFVLASFLTAQAQVLQSQNFDALTVGNVGTDLTGAEAGQGGIKTLLPAGGDATSFQIVAGGKVANGFQITGSDEDAGTTNETDNTRYAWIDGLADAWAGRTEGNEAISVEFDFYATIAEGTANEQRITLFNSTFSNNLAGYTYDPATGELRGIANFTNEAGQTGLFTFTLKEGGAILTPNTWYKLGFIFVPSTGDVIWGTNDILVEDEEGNMVGLRGSVTSEPNVGLEPAELDFMAIAGDVNAVASSAIYDNLNVKAIASIDEFLGTKEVVNVASQFSVYPNPTNSVLNVVNNGDVLVNAIQIVDLNGRTVKSVKFDGVAEAQVNVSDLASGVYMATISSDKGTTTKKIVKN